MDATAVDAAHRADRRRFLRAATIGAALGAIVFLLVSLDGHWTLLQRGYGTDFYDAQAHSLLNLHWDIPPRIAGIEGLLLDGKTYLYYGPWPALIRLPIAAFTDSFDGELTQISMLVAYAVTMTFTVRIAWRLRALVRAQDPVTRGECWALGITIFAIAGGSVLVFLAGYPSVYHEAELWGAALTIAALDFVIAFAVAPTNRSLVLASLLAALAFLTRGSVGAGPVVALGLLLLASTTAWTRRFAGLPEDTDLRRYGLKLGVAAAIPVLLYAAVNYSKFGSFFSLPLDQQVFAFRSPWRRAVLDSNGGSLFSLKYIPTTAFQFLRPDALHFDGLIPWVQFPGRAHVFGRVYMAGIEPTSSIPASMPALTLLGLAGLVGLVRPPATDGPTLRVVRAPMVGALTGAFVTLTIAYVAQRYLSDFMPALVLAGLVGFHLLLRWLGSNRRRTVALVAVLGVLALASLWFNVGFAVLYGHKVGVGLQRSEVADFVAFQYRLHKRIPGGSPPHVRRGESRPYYPLAAGTVFIVGDCRLVYWSSGYRWISIPTTPGNKSAFC